MRKQLISAVTAAFLVGVPLAHAQQPTSSPGATPDSGRLTSQLEFKILVDARIGMIKAALQLTPEQQQLWPAVEEAIRARSDARFRRLSAFVERAGQWREVDPVQLYRQRADVLTERAAGLKKLADAWQPLYQTLTPDQKTRLRLVALRAAERVRALAESREVEIFDVEDPDEP